LLTLSLLTIILISCVTTLSSGGARIRTVTDDQKECCCEFITIVTASEEFGLNQGMDAESAMNKVRNKIALLGGNAMSIISINSTEWGTIVTAEALKCDF
jgi:hypothetical protein